MKIVPYRIEVCSGWIDDIRVNSWTHGSMIVMSILPEFDVQPKSGLASSTHDLIVKMNLPLDYKAVASVDSEAGSQDACGICCGGMSVLNYGRGNKIPLVRSLSVENAEWFKSVVALKHSPQRSKNFNPIEGMNCSLPKARALSASSIGILLAIDEKDRDFLYQSLQGNYEAQLEICPAMHKDMPKDFLKWTGAGGGGYYLSSDIENGLPYKIRYNSGES